MFDSFVLLFKFQQFFFHFSKFSFSGCFISFLLHTPLSVWDRDLLFFSSSPFSLPFLLPSLYPWARTFIVGLAHCENKAMCKKKWSPKEEEVKGGGARRGAAVCRTPRDILLFFSLSFLSFFPPPLSHGQFATHTHGARWRTTAAVFGFFFARESGCAKNDEKEEERFLRIAKTGFLFRRRARV